MTFFSETRPEDDDDAPDCPTCDGTGEIEVRSHLGPEFDTSGRCPDCGGTGAAS